MWSEGWAIVDLRSDVTVAIPKAIEGPPTVEATDAIVRGLSIMLGKSGIAAANTDAARRIVNSGRMPLLVALVEVEGPSAAMFITMAESCPKRVSVGTKQNCAA